MQEVIGTIGVALILLGFVLQRYDCIKCTDLTYNGLNACGALLLMRQCFAIKATNLFFLESVWFLVALHGCITARTRKIKRGSVWKN